MRVSTIIIDCSILGERGLSRFTWKWARSQFSSIQSLSRVQVFATPWTAAHQSSLSITNSQSPLSPLSQWCHPAISSSVVPFSSWLQPFAASGSFHMSQFFASGGQSIGVSASASLLPVNIQDWFPFRWTGWISQKWRVLNGRCQAHSSRVWSKTRLTRFYFYFL